jgi:hypothetical protein
MRYANHLCERFVVQDLHKVARHSLEPVLCRISWLIGISISKKVWDDETISEIFQGLDLASPVITAAGKAMEEQKRWFRGSCSGNVDVGISGSIVCFEAFARDGEVVKSHDELFGGRKLRFQFASSKMDVPCCKLIR